MSHYAPLLWDCFSTPAPGQDLNFYGSLSRGGYRSAAGERAWQLFTHEQDLIAPAWKRSSAGKRHINFFYNIRLLVLLFPRRTHVKLETKSQRESQAQASALKGGRGFWAISENFLEYFCPLHQANSTNITLERFLKFPATHKITRKELMLPNSDNAFLKPDLKTKETIFLIFVAVLDFNCFL